MYKLNFAPKIGVFRKKKSSFPIVDKFSHFTYIYGILILYFIKGKNMRMSLECIKNVTIKF